MVGSVKTRMRKRSKKDTNISQHARTLTDKEASD